MNFGARWQSWWLSRWFGTRPGWCFAGLLAPLAMVYRTLAAAQMRRSEAEARAKGPLRCPVIVVGNLVVGGAGKTPTTIALVRSLREAGYHAGVVSRGHGRQGEELAPVETGDDASRVGDEPLLIRRRSGAPVWVGRDRRAAAEALLRRHPDVDVIVADDALQHRRLARDIEVAVFDERGIGNGRLLPAGPLREPFTARPGAKTLVLYNHWQPTTPWPGACATRRLAGAWPLHRWLSGEPGEAVPLSSLRGRRLLAMAGIAVPDRFFGALSSAGLDFDRLPLPDHYDYVHPPWPDDSTEVLTTEKDAVKLACWAGRRMPVWVVGLDLELPRPFVTELLARLGHATRT